MQVLERSSFTLRAWEIAVFGAVAAGTYWVWTESQKEGAGAGEVPNDILAFILGGPLGWGVAKSFGWV